MTPKTLFQFNDAGKWRPFDKQSFKTNCLCWCENVSVFYVYVSCCNLSNKGRINWHFWHSSRASRARCSEQTPNESLSNNGLHHTAAPHKTQQNITIKHSTATRVQSPCAQLQSCRTRRSGQNRFLQGFAQFCTAQSTGRAAPEALESAVRNQPQYFASFWAENTSVISVALVNWWCEF